MQVFQECVLCTEHGILGHWWDSNFLILWLLSTWDIYLDSMTFTQSLYPPCPCDAPEPASAQIRGGHQMLEGMEGNGSWGNLSHVSFGAKEYWHEPFQKPMNRH